MRKINLLPNEDKNSILFSNITKGTIGLLILMTLFVAFQGGITVKKYFELNKVKDSNTEIKSIQASIDSLKAKEQEKILLLQNMEEVRLPFYEFTNFFTTRLPEDVILLSMDSKDILAPLEGSKTEAKTINIPDPNNPSKTIIVNSKAEILDASGKVISTIDPALLPTGFYEGETTVNADGTPAAATQTKKINDIIIRGYSKNNSSIAKFFYELSILTYVKAANITAIEEKTIDNGARVNVFEFTLEFN